MHNSVHCVADGGWRRVRAVCQWRLRCFTGQAWVKMLKAVLVPDAEAIATEHGGLQNKSPRYRIPLNFSLQPTEPNGPRPIHRVHFSSHPTHHWTNTPRSILRDRRGPDVWRTSLHVGQVYGSLPRRRTDPPPVRRRVPPRLLPHVASEACYLPQRPPSTFRPSIHWSIAGEPVGSKRSSA